MFTKEQFFEPEPQLWFVFYLDKAQLRNKTMKSYQSIQDARIKHPEMGKYDYETVLINNKPTVLCGTTLVQEELFEEPLTKMFEQLAEHIPNITELSPNIDAEELAKTTFVQILDTLKNDYNIQFAEKYDSY